MKKAQFSPSLMCMDLMNAGAQLTALSKRADQFHVDLMDGHFAPNITLSPDFVKAAKPYAGVPMEVHMMVEHPRQWIDLLIEAGASTLSMHAETINKDAFRQLNRITSQGAQAGVVLNPATPLAEIEYYVDRLALVTLMTIDVGFAGQPFIEEMLTKIDQLAEFRSREGLDFTIQIDGSCNARTYKRLRDAGAEMFIVGTSGLFSLDSDIDKAWDLLEEQFEAATGEHVG